MSCSSDPFEQAERLMGEASRAVQDANYGLAEEKAIAAQALLAGVPTMQVKQGYAGGTLQYTPERINEFLKQVRLLANRAARQIQMAPLEFVKPGGIYDY